MKIESRGLSVEPFEGNILVTLGEAPMQPRTAFVLTPADALKLANAVQLTVLGPPNEPVCNGTVVHDFETLCPRCDR